MKYEPCGGGLIIEEKNSDYIFGSGQLTAPEVRPDGDWTAYLPKNEDQKKRGIETSACATFATINSIEILMEEMGLGVDFDYSERYISLLSGTTQQGNSPTKVAETIRKHGLIPESMMPFDDSIESWEDFNSWKGVDMELCLAAGQQWLKKYSFNYDLGWRGDITVEEKHKILDGISKFCPPPVSVLAWYSDGQTYYKPQGGEDNHLTLRAKKDTVFDTYEPFLKPLKPLYDHLIALRVVITPKKVEKKSTFWQMIVDLIKKIFDRDYRMFGALRSPKWGDIRNAFLKENPLCSVCGKKKNLSVHHKKSFYEHPELELDKNNLVTLCESAGMNCHITFGHLGNWKRINPNVDSDILIWKEKLK